MSQSDAPVSRNLLLVLAGVVALALLWFFVVSPLLDDTDDAADPTAAPTEVETDPDAPTEEPTEAEGDDVVLVTTYEIFLARDPFSPVVPETDTGGNGGTDGDGNGGTDGDGNGGTDGDGNGGTDGDGNGGTDGDGDGNGGTDGDGDGNGGTDGDGNGGTDGDGNGDGNGGTDGNGDSDRCDTADSEAVCEGIVVSVRGFDPDTGRAIVRVGGADYLVAEGDVFAEWFRVLDIQAPCVTLLYGDEAFTICEGDRVLK